LVRQRATRPQVELGEADRLHNVRDAFAVSDPDLVDRRRILLIDDVFTTGATVDECARTLRRAGAIQVDVLTLARTGIA
jgi:predicted amidophosphoribosyltransferase